MVRAAFGDLDDNSHMQKYLPHKNSFIFAPPLCADNDNDFFPSLWLLQAIKEVAIKVVTTSAPPPFRFLTDPSNTVHNSEFLCLYDYNRVKLLKDHQNTFLAYRSEFCPLNNLVIIFDRHILFPFFSSLHTNNMEYTLTTELTDDEQIAKLQANLA